MCALLFDLRGGIGQFMWIALITGSRVYESGDVMSRAVSLGVVYMHVVGDQMVGADVRVCACMHWAGC